MWLCLYELSFCDRQEENNCGLHSAYYALSAVDQNAQGARVGNH